MRLFAVFYALLLAVPNWASASSAEVVRVKEEPCLVLYYSPYCPHSQMVLGYLTKIHKTLPMINVYDNPKAKEELKRIGGKMQVPCLIVHGQPLYESDLIVYWLANHQEDLETGS